MARPKLERISQREYARRLGISNEAVSKAIREGKISKGWDKKEGKIIFETANEEWGALHLKTDIPKLLKQEVGEPIRANYPTRASSANGMTLSADSSYAEAKRVREIIVAQIAALELKERKEELVKKDEVYKQLYNFGQEVRTAITSLPDRHIDSMLAAKSRPEAYQILSGAVYDILDKLTKSDFDFSPRQ